MHNDSDNDSKEKESPKLKTELHSNVNRQEEPETDSDIYSSTESEDNISLSQSNADISRSLPSQNLRKRDHIKPHPKYNDYHSQFSLIGQVENISVDEALQNPAWKNAMSEEINSLIQMNSWELTELPEGKKTLESKWVFRNKGSKKKARMVVKGCSQKQGVDYTTTFAPVASHTSIRLLISHGANSNY